MKWSVGFVACSAFFVCATVARAARLEVGDLFVSYATQTATEATGTVSFTLRFAALDGDPGEYDLVSTQVLLARMGVGTNAKFSLDDAATENTAPLGANYWLPTPPTFFQNASTHGGEFRFSDFVSILQAHTPDAGNAIARFAIDFTVDSADEFGTYEVIRGDASRNFFSRDLSETYANDLDGGTFTLQPIPEPATALTLIVGIAMLRRRR